MDPLDFGKLINKIKSGDKIIYIIQDDKGHTITFVVFKNYSDIKI